MTEQTTSLDQRRVELLRLGIELGIPAPDLIAWARQTEEWFFAPASAPPKAPQRRRLTAYQPAPPIAVQDADDATLLDMVRARMQRRGVGYAELARQLRLDGRWLHGVLAGHGFGNRVRRLLVCWVGRT